MAVTQNSYIGNGSTTTYSFTFPYLKASDIKASLDAVDTTAFTLPTATTLQFNTAPTNGAKIKIFRETATDNLTATFYAGSAIKSEDLNENFTQNLYSTQEISSRYLSNLGGTMVGNFGLGEDADIVFEGATDNTNETTITVADPTADRTITFPDTTGTVVTTGDTGTVTSTMLADGTIVAADLASNSVTTAKITDANVTTAKIAADAVTGAKIADDQINSEHYVAGSIDTEHIANSQITNAKMADNSVNTAELVDDAVTAAKLASNSVVSASIVDGSIATADIADNAITNAKMADDSVGAAELVDTSVGTAALASNAVTNAKMADASVGTSELVNDAVTTVKIANSQVTTAKIADSNVTTAKINNDAVTSAKIADNAIGNEHLQDDSVRTAEIQASAVTTAKIANNAVTSAKIAANAVTTTEIADAELTTLAGMQSGTASILASSTALTATTTELNQLDGKTIQTTVADNDAQLPTSGAIVDYVAAQIAPLGGLEVIATEVAFPNTQPASGVVISISDAGGIVVNGSGVSTTGRTVGGSTVTINGFPSSLQSSTLAASIGLLVSSTGSSQTYNYHKILGKESDITALSDDINDFNNRYRVSGSAPTSSLDNGDLWFDTTNGKMMVYNTSASAWEEVSAIGSFNINTLSSSGNTGGGSATFNGTAYRFTLSNPPQDAQQLLVSINGVVQKPNSGSSQPSEGFAISGNDIIFSAAPASGSISFIITLGQSVQIGTPSDNTISTAKIQNLAVTGDKIATNLDLADNKKIRFGTGADLKIYHNGSDTYFEAASTAGQIIHTANEWRLQNLAKNENMILANQDGLVRLYYDGSTKIETTSGGASVTGELDVSGHVDVNSDTARLKLGAGDDLQLYHDGTNSYILNNGGQLRIQPKTGEYAIICDPDGSVDLYHNNTKRFETTAAGVQFAGTEIKGPDNCKFVAGTSGDADFYHDGSATYIRNMTGDLCVRSDNNILLQPYSGDELFAKFVNDGGVELYYDNDKKFETASLGVYSKSIMPASHETFDIGQNMGRWNDIYIADNGKLKIGQDNDLQIFHDGNQSIIRDTGTGSLMLQGSQIIMESADGGEVLAKFIDDGSVELYEDNTKRFETQSGGCRVYGHLGVNRDPAGSHPLWVQGSNQYVIGITNTSAHSTYFPWLLHKSINSTQAFGIHFNGLAGDPFHVDQNGGIFLNKETATANRLDDYEEGTWTPGVEGFNNVTFQSTEHTGHYTKIGRLVYLDFYLRFESGGSTTSNGSHIKITGLPFALMNTNRTRGGGTTSFESIASSNDGGAGNISFYGDQANAKFNCYVGSNAWTATNGTSQAGAYIIGTFIYHA